MRRSLTDEVKAVFTVHDTHIGLVNDNADLTVNGGLRVTGGATGVLHLPGGTQAIKAGENVIVSYNSDGTVEISTQEGEDISHILQTVDSFDTRVTQAESDIALLQSQQSATAASVLSIQTSVNSVVSQNSLTTQTLNSIIESFSNFESRVMTAEGTVNSVLESESAQNSRITLLEDGLYEERLARIAGDSSLSSQIGALSTALSVETNNRVSGDSLLSGTISAISSSFSSLFQTSSDRITVLQSDVATLGNRVTSLEFASSTFSTEINSINLSSQSMSSSVASDVNYLKALFMSGVIADISGNMILETLSGTFSDRLTSAESLFQTIPATLNTLSSSFSERSSFLEITASALQGDILALQSRATVLEIASSSFSEDISLLFGSLSAQSSSFETSLTNLNVTVTSLSSSFASEISELKISGGGGGFATSVGQFAFNETPTGAIDGSNVIFGLANSPSPPSSLMLFHNGQLLSVGPDYDYVLNGSVITFVGGIVPAPDDVILATYQYTSPAKTYSFNESVTLVVSAGVLQGVLDHEPDPPSSLMLFFNGQLLSAGPGRDFTLSGKNIEITSTDLQTDDVCLATYSHY